MTNLDFFQIRELCQTATRFNNKIVFGSELYIACSKDLSQNSTLKSDLSFFYSSGLDCVTAQDMLENQDYEDQDGFQGASLGRSDVVSGLKTFKLLMNHD